MESWKTKAKSITLLLCHSSFVRPAAHRRSAPRDCHHRITRGVVAIASYYHTLLHVTSGALMKKEERMGAAFALVSKERRMLGFCYIYEGLLDWFIVTALFCWAFSILLNFESIYVLKYAFMGFCCFVVLNIVIIFLDMKHSGCLISLIAPMMHYVLNHRWL